jgi:hypothetical protein
MPAQYICPKQPWTGRGAQGSDGRDPQTNPDADDIIFFCFNIYKEKNKQEEQEQEQGNFNNGQRNGMQLLDSHGIIVYPDGPHFLEAIYAALEFDVARTGGARATRAKGEKVTNIVNSIDEVR